MLKPDLLMSTLPRLTFPPGQVAQCTVRSPSHPICQQTGRLISSRLHFFFHRYHSGGSPDYCPLHGHHCLSPPGSWLLALKLTCYSWRASAAPNQPDREVVSATTYVSTHLPPPLSRLHLSGMTGIESVANPSCRAQRWAQKWHQYGLGDASLSHLRTAWIELGPWPLFTAAP